MIEKLGNSFYLKIFLARYLPMAFLAGLRLKIFEEVKAVTSVKYSYLTQNPFKSIYFAVQCMAAEFSTAVLVVRAIERSGMNVAIIITNLEANFVKKAIGRTYFTCEVSDELEVLMKNVLDKEEGDAVKMKSIGRNDQGEIVSEFQVTWSLKRRS